MTTTINVDDLLARLQAHYARLGDGRDCRSQRERADWYAATTTCAQLISGLMNGPQDVARQQARLDDLEASRAAVVAKIAEVEQAILDAPPWREHPDARERDRRYDHIAQLRRQLEHLHAGTLLRAPDRCYERLDDLDRRIKEVTERRNRLQLQLDAHLRQAEALLAAATVG